MIYALIWINSLFGLQEIGGKSREVVAVMDYQLDPGPNTNPKTGFIFGPPPQGWRRLILKDNYRLWFWFVFEFVLFGEQSGLREKVRFWALCGRVLLCQTVICEQDGKHVRFETLAISRLVVPSLRLCRVALLHIAMLPSMYKER